LNRIDETIMFSPLTRSEINDIVRLLFAEVQKRLERNDIRISISEAAVDKLANIGYDPQFGARPLKRVIQKEVLNELSKMILSGKLNKDESILVDVDGDRIVFTNK
jgi:ATP-dependent Clp protease ATP-binding subunit ClpB